MWRTVFLMLVLANLIFHAWGQGYFGGQDEGRESARLSGQFQPEKLRVVNRAAGEPGGAEVESGMSEDAAPATMAEPPAFLVHVPPLPSKAAADKKAAEIRQLGITDFHVVTGEGPARFSIFFGQFGNEQAANEFLAGLASKGVRSARVQAMAAP